MMEWYYGQEAGDLVVPKDQEYFDRLPSPDSWSQWGMCGSGNSGWPNNLDAGKISSLPDEKSQQQMLFGKGSKEIDLPEEVERSSGSSNIEGSSEDSLPRNAAACGRADFYFSNLAGTDAMDDMFLNSLIQDDVPVAAANHGPFSFSPQYQHSMTSSDSDFANKMLDCHSVPYGTATDSLGNLKCFPTPPFSPSDGSDNGHVSLSNLSYGNYSDQSSGPSPKTRDTLSSEQEASRRSGEEESAVEELVLMGLEAVLIQLSNKSRLCLRDSLYRLAHHSKEHMSKKSKVEELPSDELSLLEDADGPSRSGRVEAAESRTNTIDRAVANLMFNKVDANLQDLLPAMASKFEHIGRNFAAVGDSNYALSQDDTFHTSKPSDLLAQSEVPLFSQQNLLPMRTEPGLAQGNAESLF